MKVQIITLALISGLFLIGCDSSTESLSLDAEETLTDIKVERGPILNAGVRDANGKFAQPLGNGVYRFVDVEYPVESFGGYIDMNRNGIVDEGDIEVGTLKLKTGAGNVITLATSLDSSQDLISLLQEIGYTEDELANATPSSDIDIAALSDEIYKYCYENNISDPSLIKPQEMQILQNRIYERKIYYNSVDVSSAELESALMDELNVVTLSDTSAIKTPSNQIDIMVDAIPTTQLTDEQKYTLAYMWNEERLARDIYLTLNELTPSNTLYNIATNAETQHVLSVENLIKKYDINIFNTLDYSGGYSVDALASYEDGSYSISAISELYNILYEKGSTSLTDALEVGCLVEVTDINDLDSDIDIAQGADDIVLVFESLREGSYAHYWAFDSALKAQGITNGCCSLGDEYCKTSQEYPQTSGGSGNGQQHGKH